MSETNISNRVYQATHIILGVIILLSCIMGGAAMAASNTRRAQVFHLWFRHMTSWNAIIASIWFFTAATMSNQTSNATLLSFGCTVLLLNLFVFFVRWGWFRMGKIYENPHHVFGDLIIHALVPIMSFLSFSMVISSSPVSRWQEAIGPGILAFWVILIIWYLINYILAKKRILPWPYPNGAGKSIPKDLYPDQSQHTPQSFYAYISMNAMIAFSLTIFALLFVFGRKTRNET